MKTRIVIGTLVMMFILTIPVLAGGKGELQKYFSKTAKEVKSIENATEKREILNQSFNKALIALNKVQSSGLISEDESNGIESIKANVQEKQDELLGNNGFERITDSQLNDFSNYVVEDLEQASVTISLLALVIIVILVVYLL
ncbi:MAG: hypothetical protein Q8N03_17430 [Ignavibacteria bacterium]|jgi:hypothetical protein|nr:hypothetical protein [Ignavibacteria bacterium]